MAAALTAFETSLADAARSLSPARAAAFDAFCKSGLPHRRMEAWKWTDLRAALGDVAPLAPANDVIAPSIFSNVGPFEITVMNGAADFGAPPAGVEVRRVEAPLGALAQTHPTANLAAAFARETLEIAVAGAIAPPILLRRIAGAGVCHSRVILRLAPGAAATLIESFDGAGAYFSNSVTEFYLGPRAAVSRILLQNGDDAGVETAVSTLALGAGARLHQTMLAFGGKAARLETIVAAAADARVELQSAAALSGARHADVTSLVRHEGPGIETRQRHRAAIRDTARGVFQGKFLVARDGQKTDADMNAGALLLSHRAEANSKPELEIYADDVKCAHGSTAGALDDAAIFYMRQRGLSEREARALLIEAFVGGIFDEGLHAGVQHILRARLARWLEAK